MIYSHANKFWHSAYVKHVINALDNTANQSQPEIAKGPKSTQPLLLARSEQDEAAGTLGE